MSFFKVILKWLLTKLYRVEVQGLEQFENINGNVIIVANHTSDIDVLLLYAFLPIDMTFAVNTHIAKSRLLKLLSVFFKMFPMDPANPLSIRALIKHVNKGSHVVIFPEGRITVTGSLMKIYQGPGLVAVRTGAPVMPICIDGAQFSPFSRIRGKKSQKIFPKIKLTIQSPCQLAVQRDLRGRQRREKAGKILSDIMTNMVFQSSNYHTTLFDRLLSARKIHGGSHIIAEDIQRKPISYNQLLIKSLALGKLFTRLTRRSEYVGVLLPGSLANLVTFWALNIYGRVPAMLNFSTGAHGMLLACKTAEIKSVVTSKLFVEKAKLENVVADLSHHVQFVYLEDIAKEITLFVKLRSFIITYFDYGLKRRHRKRGVLPDSPAVVLFTSGSEGAPKGVVLSHANLLANMSQLASRIDFNAQDVALNALPLFHSFGLMAGTLLPILAGIKTFLYPTPLHYRIIPEVAYDINATIMFGTNTFLAGYARFAHAYDFYSVRYVFAGAEKLQQEVRRVWEDKFGVRIFEGYGATEASPVISSNTPMANKFGTVGRIMPGMECHLVAVPGIKNGKRLIIKGPNVMLGYLLDAKPGLLVPPTTERGDGWYDTGDIVDIDDDGYIIIKGRAKRFAKVAGEMVSLTVVETLASTVWQEALHAAVAVTDKLRGEQIVLLTTQALANRAELIAKVNQDKLGELTIPRKVITVETIPVLGTGKTDYVSVLELAKSEL